MAWLIFYKRPRDQKNSPMKNVTPSSAARNLSIRPITLKKMSPWQILRNRQFWGIALPRFAEPATGAFNAWIPLFMFKVYGLT